VNGKDLRISYPCVVLNVMVAKHQTNPQYATLVDAAEKSYTTTSEMSIEFEVDGPYKVSRDLSSYTYAIFACEMHGARRPDPASSCSCDTCHSSSVEQQGKRAFRQLRFYSIAR
jgi:hypothetical protein